MNFSGELTVFLLPQQKKICHLKLWIIFDFRNHDYYFINNSTINNYQQLVSLDVYFCSLSFLFREKSVWFETLCHSYRKCDNSLLFVSLLFHFSAKSFFYWTSIFQRLFSSLLWCPHGTGISVLEPKLITGWIQFNVLPSCPCLKLVVPFCPYTQW